jgi:hypothetical protein
MSRNHEQPPIAEEAYARARAYMEESGLLSHIKVTQGSGRYWCLECREARDEKLDRRFKVVDLGVKLGLTWDAVRDRPLCSSFGTIRAKAVDITFWSNGDVQVTRPNVMVRTILPRTFKLPYEKWKDDHGRLARLTSRAMSLELVRGLIGYH